MAEAKGLHVKAAKDAIKIADKGDISDTVLYLEELTKNLRLLGLPLKSEQLDMFETAPQSQPLDERAYEQGHGSGVLGEGQDKNLHDPTSEAGQAWLRGFHEGCAARAELERQDNAESAEGGEEDAGQMDMDNAA